jgi:hypothetical protein
MSVRPSVLILVERVSGLGGSGDGASEQRGCPLGAAAVQAAAPSTTAVRLPCASRLVCSGYIARHWLHDMHNYTTSRSPGNMKGADSDGISRTGRTVQSSFLIGALCTLYNLACTLVCTQSDACLAAVPDA